MSKIGTEVIVGQIFKPIVTTFTYDELKTYRDNDTSIGINNALIISVPQKQLDNAEYDDDIDETSIWATDNSGLLCPLSFPYSKISQIEESLKQYEENTTAKKILSVKWTRGTGTSEAGTSPNINIKVEVTYANNRTALLNITGIKVYKNPQFTEEYTTVVTAKPFLFSLYINTISISDISFNNSLSTFSPNLSTTFFLYFLNPVSTAA